jgi:geranylgeranyl reductase family protein
MALTGGRLLMEIAVVGGGPGGSWAAILLARRGHSVTLLDPQAPWEKPCGGGVTSRALERFDIFSSDLPRKKIEEITVFFGDRSSVKVVPQQPLVIVSRKEMGEFLLKEASSCGVRVLHERVTSLQRDQARWRVTTKARTVEADFVVGADGATSFVRRSLGTPLHPQDLCITLGYYIPGEGPPTMKIFFVPSLEGYIWSFPRPNHISYGLISRSGPGRTARAKELLSNFISADLGSEALRGAEFYSAPVPCLTPESWKTNVIGGDRWALVGDAAGLTDPITGEGIYFAFRSAEILAETIEWPLEYPKAIWRDMGVELARASHMYGKFYTGQFLGADFRKRAVQLARRSRTIRQLVQTFIEGKQPYQSLKKKLFYSVPSVAWDLVSGRQ